ncbi:MAG: hypothetical protein EBT83_08125 [Betaproteobacteria bacterium]|nr:hypothetical protein [Betaproteobacteria bacterium]
MTRPRSIKQAACMTLVMHVAFLHLVTACGQIAGIPGTGGKPSRDGNAADVHPELRNESGHETPLNINDRDWPQFADASTSSDTTAGVAISNLGQTSESKNIEVSKVNSLMPSWEDIKVSIGPIMRGTAIGTVFGILPGSHTVIASFSSYTLEKKLSKTPERFGKGAIEGVAGPESANNAAAQTCFIPLLTLGIPTGAVMALMVGAMTIQGIAPGPQVMTQKPDLFWGMIASMWIGNLMLVILNLPLIGIWVQFLRIPYRVLFPSILLFIAIGAYSINNSPFEVYMAALFGFFGYYASKWGCEAAPLILGFVLGPLMEENLRRAMLISRGDPSVFFTRPISLGMLLVSFALLLMVVMPQFQKKREILDVADD